MRLTPHRSALRPASHAGASSATRRDGKCIRSGRSAARERLAVAPPAAPPRTETESRRRQSRLRPFASQRFHALLNSLFKVLCNFPSRYLFAIDQLGVFSLGWGLPPALGCTPEQPDSAEATRSSRPAAPHRPPAFSGRWPRSRGLGGGRGRDRPSLLSHHSSRPGPPGRDSVLGSSPFTRRYWGNRRYFLFAPLTDMLKFGGCSRLIRGRVMRAQLAACRRRSIRRACVLESRRLTRRVRSSSDPRASSYVVHDPLESVARGGNRATSKPTLGQTWRRESVPTPQCAFEGFSIKVSAIHNTSRS
jgi:hypothetical protein